MADPLPLPSTTVKPLSLPGSQAQQQDENQPPDLSYLHSDNMKSVFDAPELNELSLSAFKGGLGGLLTGNREDLEGILRQQYPDAGIGAGMIRLPSGTYKVESNPIARFAFDTGLFASGGGLTGPLLKRLAKEGARATAIEGGMQGAEQALGGAEIDPKQMALAGVMGAGGEAASTILSSTLRGIFGNIDDQTAQIIRTGQDANVPVLTSDVIPPKTFMGQTAQRFYERIPFLGTGAVRNKQQLAREGLIDQLAIDFNIEEFEWFKRH